MGKIIAVDFGLKRTGLAISDEKRSFAFGLKTINSQELETEVHRLIETELVDTLVIGMPKRLNNEDSHISENVRMLGSLMEERYPNIQIVLFDERFTSKMAVQAMHTSGATRKQKANKSLIDMVSATILLQSYIDQVQNTSIK